jgi:SAM-dependent methyltransferase
LRVSPNEKDAVIKPDYGNWIRLRVVLTFFLIGLVPVGLAFLPIWWPFRLLLLALGAFPLGTGIYLIYVYSQFAAWGGGFQDKLWTLVLDHLSTDGHGHALDIGTGNGALAVRLAKRYPGLKVSAIDFWGKGWEYGQATCERNARLEGVGDRVDFQKASAASLPFDDSTFDQVVSHFVFHEVADAPDKREVIREALRVLRKGGSFSFQDMFLDEKIYGDPAALVETIRSWGVDEVAFMESGGELNIPPLLRNGRTLGHASIIYGRK